ncbi:hypothetical protein [Pseudomonas sp. SWRI154]|uniref:hypothetical protein n=1 Tax=Pseudomonas sp. SWRI154 TaxID=2745501 RepID=UPI0016490F62|nr:hypothetical protein [Pseudomonas sp. SWRI154]MBC3365996.1 hypothetical protein [Pseudomonas sp. SWRI154]
MKNCEYCGALVLADDGACKRCSEAMRLMAEAPAPSGPSRGLKILKWLLVGLLVAVLVAVAGIIWVLNTLGPMPSFG